MPVARTLPLEEWRPAMELLASGRARGKLLLLPDARGAAARRVRATLLHRWMVTSEQSEIIGVSCERNIEARIGLRHGTPEGGSLPDPGKIASDGGVWRQVTRGEHPHRRQRKHRDDIGGGEF